MTRIIFSFDTEDFTCEHAADGIKDMADLLTEEGLRGCFCVTGYVAKQLAAWGREDVIAALLRHEIDFHTLRHTMHPTVCEYTDTDDYSYAYSRVIREESEGLALVRALSGDRNVYAAVPPGEGKSYAAMYAYADLGVPMYCDTYADTPDGAGAFFCNALHLSYYTSLEAVHGSGAALNDAFYEKLAARRYAVLYNHPNMLTHTEFWDSVNFKGRNLYPDGLWREAPRRSDEDRKAMLETARKVIRRLKSDGRFEFTTYAEVAFERCTGTRAVRPDDIPAIRASLMREFAPQTQPVSLSVSDVFLCAADFLKGAKIHLCGRVYGFLEEPKGITEPCEVPAEAVREAVRKLDLTSFLPLSVEVRDIYGETVSLGAADFLFAMLGVLCGESKVALTPRPQNISLENFPKLANPPIRNWGVRDPDSCAATLIRRLPLQAWTLRL